MFSEYSNAKWQGCWGVLGFVRKRVLDIVRKLEPGHISDEMDKHRRVSPKFFENWCLLLLICKTVKRGGLSASTIKRPHLSLGRKKV